MQKHRFLDGSGSRGQNDRVITRPTRIGRSTSLWRIVATAAALTCLWTDTAPAQSSQRSSHQPATIYWCPDRPADQQISARPEAGCAPLAESPTRKTRKGDTQKALAPIKMEQIQTVASQFLQRYDHFLDCCADDVAELDRVRELEAEASHILGSIQSSGIYNAGTVVRQFTLGEVVRQVAQSRRDLQRLEARLEGIGKGMDQLEGVDPERAARAARELEADRNAIMRDFRVKRPAPGARTGVNIQDTTVPNWYGESPTGSSTLKSTTGTDIGRQSDLVTRPGQAIRETTLSDRYGTDAEETSLRSSTGFGIERGQNAGGLSTTPTRVGPDLGDSNLNR